jgi:hypothetical protein
MTLARFDDADRLNDDGTVTFRIIPSSWRRYNISPDTYQLVNGDSWTESEIEWWSQETGRDLTYDDLSWEYDHAGIVRGFAEELAHWISEELMGAGLNSLANVRVVDSWSPQFYNFTSDGFEVEITCDPAELRGLTGDFDVDDWVHEWYRSCDGFISYVPSRLDDSEWRAGYDAEFRVESLLASLDPSDNEDWRYRLWEAEHEVYGENTRVEILHPEYMDSGYTLPELEEWARELSPSQSEALF